MIGSQPVFANNAMSMNQSIDAGGVSSQPTSGKPPTSFLGVLKTLAIAIVVAVSLLSFPSVLPWMVGFPFAAAKSAGLAAAGRVFCHLGGQAGAPYACDDRARVRDAACDRYSDSPSTSRVARPTVCRDLRRDIVGVLGMDVL